jgi:hypothetical protein
MARWFTGLLMVALAGLAGEAAGQGKKSDSVVKVAATADKPDADGKQVLTVTFAMEGKWHIYANPVDNDMLTSAQTVISVAGKEKPRDVKVDYPPGKLVKDKVVGDYKVYEDKVAIKANVHRAKGDTGPLELTVKFMACDDKTCLLPATVKLTVP